MANVIMAKSMAFTAKLITCALNGCEDWEENTASKIEQMVKAKQKRLLNSAAE